MWPVSANLLINWDTETDSRTANSAATSRSWHHQHSSIVNADNPTATDSSMYEGCIINKLQNGIILLVFTHSHTHAPLMRQCCGLPHRLAQCMSPQGWGKLVNAVLLTLINEACVSVCCATLLSSELVGPTWVQAWSSNPRGRACRPSGKGSGEEGILSDVVPA